MHAMESWLLVSVQARRLPSKLTFNAKQGAEAVPTLDRQTEICYSEAARTKPTPREPRDPVHVPPLYAA